MNPNDPASYLTPEQVQQALALLQAQKWSLIVYLALSVGIGALVRLCKADSPLPPLAKIPPVWRARIAILLGFLGSVLAKVATGVTWTQALTIGLGAGGTSIAGHEVVVEGLRQGRELFARSRFAPFRTGRGDQAPPPSGGSGGDPGAGVHLRTAALRGALALVALVAVACQPGSPVAPAAGDLGACLLLDVTRSVPLPSLVQLVAWGLANCGGDAEALLAAIVRSLDPSFAPYKADAQATLASPAKLETFKGDVKGYLTLHPELHK
jgi:hypothetical protein